ncbi:serine/threonine-protein kinase [Streptomyces sp. NPDC048337]|uniref:serine/threonine-protein kinase n=1 Tax=Streptomyces sp. NPDC048337 TaxID=3365535 RepID=UPI0037197BC1
MTLRQLRESDPAALGPYRLLAELGRGGMGRVLLGAAPDGRLAAVKQVHDRLAADDGFRARFRREVAASQKVSGAYTAAVMAADPDAPTPWLASVYVAGPSLGAAVEGAGALPEETVRRLAAGLASALVEIHRAGLVHRDLKPDNVLLAADGVRVIDFGIARIAEGGADAAELTQSGLVVGSPAYMSPEQAEGKELTPASDVFSLGSVLAMAATGSSPFAAPSTLLTLYNLVHAAPELGALPPGLRGIVEWCLAKDPAARPTPAQVLGAIGPVGTADRPWPPAVHRMVTARQAEIARLLGDPERTVVHPLRAPAPVAPPTAVVTRLDAAAPRGRPGRRTAAWVAGGVLATAAIGGGAYAWWRDGGEQSAAGPADKYAAMPICAEAAGKLPLPERRKDRDGYDQRTDSAKTSCEWYGASWEAADGKVVHPSRPDAIVTWELQRSDPRKGNGTERARKDFGEGRSETGLGVGDAAYWGAPDTYYEIACTLNVRDGNLVVSVVLGDQKYPEAAGCESKAKDIARAAVAAMPV